MSTVLALDAETISVLARPRGEQFEQVRAALEAARRLQRDVVTPAVTLAELYRSPGRNQTIDSWLSRENWVLVRTTDRPFARCVGGVLAASQSDSTDLGDAHVVACVVESGSGMVLTGDPDDMTRLAAPYLNVHVVGI